MYFFSRGFPFPFHDIYSTIVECPQRLPSIHHSTMITPSPKRIFFSNLSKSYADAIGLSTLNTLIEIEKRAKIGLDLNSDIPDKPTDIIPI